MINELKKKLSYQGLDFEKYLEHIKKTEEELKKGMEPEAKNRILLQLAFSELIKKEKTEVTEQEINEEVERILTAYPHQDHDKLKEKYQKGNRDYGLIEHQLKIGKTLKKIMAEAA